MRLLTAGAALIASADAFTLTGAGMHVQSRARSVVLSEDVVDNWDNLPWGDPREGKPFGSADRDENGNSRLAAGGEVRRSNPPPVPNAITDATVIVPTEYMYIENDDEPWHATSKQTVVLTAPVAAEKVGAMLPFIAPEDELKEAYNTAGSAKDIKAAIDAALKKGARPGCPAITGAENMIKLFEKSAEDAKKKQAPPKKKVTAQGKGWDDMARAVAKVHDNSVA